MDYSYRNSSEEGPTVDIWQGYTVRKPPSINGIGMLRVSRNNQAANWGRLFDMMEDQKKSFMDKDMVQRSTPAYMAQRSQNAKWGRLFKGSDCWLKQITWTPVSDNSMGCQEYETQWGRTYCGYLKRMYCEKPPPSVNGIGCREYSSIKWHQILLGNHLTIFSKHNTKTMPRSSIVGSYIDKPIERERERERMMEESASLYWL